MPPLKKFNPKEKFYEQGLELIKDTDNSQDPEIKKLRLKAAKRYFAQDALGDAKISPSVGLGVAVFAFLFLSAISYYAAVNLNARTFASVLLASGFFAFVILILVLALCGVMTENAISKTIVSMWNKMLLRFSKTDS